MKTNPIQTSTDSNFHSSKPFFNGSRTSTYFPQSAEKNPFFFPSAIQTKLTIGQPGDKYEKEADSMSEKVVQGFRENNSSSLIQSKCEACEEENLQKKEERRLSLKPGLLDFLL